MSLSKNLPVDSRNRFHTGTMEGKVTGRRIFRTAHPSPRTRSAPCNIVKREPVFAGDGSFDPMFVDSQVNHHNLGTFRNMYIQYADRIESKLQWLMQRDERSRVNERDDGYHSGDNEWDNQHGRVFYLDEELAVLARRVRSDDNIPFPDYLFVPDVTIAGPKQRAVPYQVEEYEELTANQRCRRSGNMRVNPADLCSLYGKVAEYYAHAQKEQDRAVPVNEVEEVEDKEIEEPEVVYEIIPEQEETPGMQFMRQRLVELRRRSTLGALADELPPVELLLDPDFDCNKTFADQYDSTPSPLMGTPEPSTIFAFDEEEMNIPF